MCLTNRTLTVSRMILLSPSFTYPEFSNIPKLIPQILFCPCENRLSSCKISSCLNLVLKGQFPSKDGLTSLFLSSCLLQLCTWVSVIGSLEVLGEKVSSSFWRVKDCCTKWPVKVWISCKKGFKAEKNAYTGKEILLNRTVWAA